MRNYRQPSPSRWILTAIIIGLVVAVAVFAIFFSVYRQPGPVPPGTSTPVATSTPVVHGNVLHVQGNKLVDSAGNQVILRGAQIETAFNVVHPTKMEQAATQHLASSTFSVMHNDWHMNVMRFPICDYIWDSDKTGYITRLQGVVSQANAAGLYVVMDLHSDQRCGAPKTSVKMPLPHVIGFWQAVASAFKNSPLVIFDAFNEPLVLGDNYEFWLHGGAMDGTTYVGMQDIVNAIRQQGAQQPIVVESMTDNKGLSAVGNNLVNDPNIIYSWHHYFKQGVERTPAGWDRLFGDFSNSHPVLIGEWAFLPNANYPTFCEGVTPDQAAQLVQSFLIYMQGHNVSWVAWNFEPTHLIVDYNTYTPTTLNTSWTCGEKTTNAGMGQLVKQYMTSAHP